MFETLLNWVADTFARSDIVDLCFFVSDLNPDLDIRLDPDELALHQSCDARTNRAMTGVRVQNGHAYDASGKDLGPVGKLSL